MLGEITLGTGLCVALNLSSTRYFGGMVFRGLGLPNRLGVRNEVGGVRMFISSSTIVALATLALGAPVSLLAVYEIMTRRIEEEKKLLDFNKPGIDSFIVAHMQKLDDKLMATHSIIKENEGARVSYSSKNMQSSLDGLLEEIETLDEVDEAPERIIRSLKTARFGTVVCMLALILIAVVDLFAYFTSIDEFILILFLETLVGILIYPRIKATIEEYFKARSVLKNRELLRET